MPLVHPLHPGGHDAQYVLLTRKLPGLHVVQDVELVQFAQLNEH
jgi:hypothetical protein